MSGHPTPSFPEKNVPLPYPYPSCLPPITSTWPLFKFAECTLFSQVLGRDAESLPSWLVCPRVLKKYEVIGKRKVTGGGAERGGSGRMKSYTHSNTGELGFREGKEERFHCIVDRCALYSGH